MSEFEDGDGNLLHGKDRRRAKRMDGMSRRELRKQEEVEGREAEEAEEEARRRDRLTTPFPHFCVTVRLLDFGSLKATAEIKMGEMTIRGFKVIENPKGGRYVAPPSREIRKNEGKPEYYDLVRFDSKEATQQFRRLILDAYEAELEAQYKG